MKTQILFEDNEVLVCHKPAGIATETAKAYQSDVVSELKNYISAKTGESTPYLGVVHRLDQPVEGLLVFAKTKESAASLTKQLENGTLRKTYRATVTGIVDKKSETLVHFLRKEPKENRSKAVSKAEYDRDRKNCKRAELTYHVVETYQDFEIKGRRYGKASLLDVEIATGRHHQIRVQLSSIGHPIIGDTRYGNVDNRAPQLMLCAYQLSFIHPKTNEEKAFSI